MHRRPVRQHDLVDDIKINSRLTLGEDVADLGGLILAWEAWRDATANQRLAPIDGLTPDQRFFVGYAQWVCENQRDEDKRVNALTNPHSPGVYRINGVVVNMPEPAAAFDRARRAVGQGAGEDLQDLRAEGAERAKRDVSINFREAAELEPLRELRTVPAFLPSAF
jgi:hypothetical protein